MARQGPLPDLRLRAALQVVAYKGSADEREAVWRREMRGGRGGGTGGAHVVLTAYDFLMAKNDK